MAKTEWQKLRAKKITIVASIVHNWVGVVNWDVGHVIISDLVQLAVLFQIHNSVEAGRNWYKFPPGTSNVLFWRLFLEFIICENPPKVTWAYVNGRSTLIPLEKTGRFEMSMFKQMQGQNPYANRQFITPYYICVTADKSVITLP